MLKTLYELNFEVRYAVRVLERQARFWRKMDIAIRMLSLLSGSAAIAALAGGHSSLTLTLGVVFALSQAMEFSIQPGSQAADAKSSIKLYSRILVDSTLSNNPELLDAALKKARSEDDVTVFDSINRIAYADVVTEIGRPECKEEPTFWLTTMRVLA